MDELRQPDISHAERSNAATLDAPLLLAPTRGDGPPPRIALVEGSGPAISQETQTLLAGRLKVAALSLFAGFAVFLAWRFLSGTSRGPHDGMLLTAQAVVTVVLGLCGISFCRKCVLPMWLLRAEEVLIFGLPAAFFILVQWLALSECAAKHRMLENPIGLWLMLLFTYAMFIPNTWRRAAVALGLMAAAPVVLLLMLWYCSVECGVLLNEDSSMVQQLALSMGISAAVAVVGVHTIGSLRQQAFEARQLGQYRLRHLIGSGGMGEVYLAEHQLMKRPCAIKTIRPEKAGDPKVLARFEREVRMTAKLSHWNSIDIFDYGRTDDGTFYYVMEYLPGMNLSDLVEQFGPLPPERVIHFMRQTCDALAEAHGVGLIHRDIKPANIFAAYRGGIYDVAKLLDFGLAKPMVEPEAGDAHLTQEGSVTGSPLYMSPEQATCDSEPDARSDIYSLGAVAYYLLTGRPPFDHEKPIKVLISVAHDAVVPPSEIRPNVPEDIEQIVLRCLEKDPDHRYQDVEDFAAALDGCESAGRWTREDANAWWETNGAVAEDPDAIPV